MEPFKIYVHDAQLHRVIENIQNDTLTMEVELPILEREEQQEPRLLVFDDAYNYQVHEQPWDGLVTILDMHVIGEQGRWYQVRIETNAGYRELFCTGVKVLEHDHVAEEIAPPEEPVPDPGSDSQVLRTPIRCQYPSPTALGELQRSTIYPLLSFELSGC
jgi:hypothetical protein